jgi:hypothetical protein
MGLPAGAITIESLGLRGANSPGRIVNVEVLGTQQRPEWKQAENGLTLNMPFGIAGIPEYGISLKVQLS